MPVAGSAPIANGYASAAPTTSPTRMPSGSEFTLRANQPIMAPATSPLKVEPSTMVRICGFDLRSGDERRETVEGAEDGAEDQAEEQLVHSHVPLLTAAPSVL